MPLLIETQQETISDELRARVAMVRPVLRGILFSLKLERVERFGGHGNVTLSDLAREYREGSGDCGICFEYCVHDAIKRQDKQIYPLVSSVIEEFIGIRGGAESILFGAEKGERLKLLETPESLLTDESRLLTGKRHQPPKLKRRLQQLARAFRQPDQRAHLPQSIRGLWRSDLFVGSSRQERWVGTTLKINEHDLEADAGIRLGIYPQRRSDDSPRRDDRKNMILCPLPYNRGFTELFYKTFFTVKVFFAADARLPKEVALPDSDDRHLASELEQRRAFKVLDIIEALEPLAQPNLMSSTLIESETGSANIIAPVSTIEKII